MVQFSAYVPSYNNSATVGSALWCLKYQSIPPAELFLIDDCSADASCELGCDLGIPVVKMAKNSGRGAVRAKAIDLAQHDLVLCCDATNYLKIDFADHILKWFADPMVAAVFGQLWQERPQTLADRWRGRHLFKLQAERPLQHDAPLSTYGCALRRSAVLQVGNFNYCLRHSEDADLGHRLLAAGYKVIFDPSLHVISAVSNSTLEVLDRYWRWHAGPNEDITLYGYLKLIWYAMTVLVPRDIDDGDLLSVLISLFCPHYQFWKSKQRKLLGRVQT